MRIIPAIDIIDRKCVRLIKGDYSTKKIYNNDPLELAKQFEDFGIQYLHLVDLDGAKSKHIVNTKILESICSKTKLKVDFGGGIKSDEDIRTAFDCGANQVTGGSIAVSSPGIFKTWLRIYGPDKIILGADSLDKKIATNGWMNFSDRNLIEFIKSYESQGLRYVICTDISRDGMLAGSSIDLYKEIISETKVNLIASGGVSSVQELNELKSIGCEGAVIGKAIYENKISLKELSGLC